MSRRRVYHDPCMREEVFGQLAGDALCPPQVVEAVRLGTAPPSPDEGAINALGGLGPMPGPAPCGGEAGMEEEDCMGEEGEGAAGGMGVPPGILMWPKAE